MYSVNTFIRIKNEKKQNLLFSVVYKPILTHFKLFTHENIEEFQVKHGVEW